MLLSTYGPDQESISHLNIKLIVFHILPSSFLSISIVLWFLCLSRNVHETALLTTSPKAPRFAYCPPGKRLQLWAAPTRRAIEEWGTGGQLQMSGHCLSYLANSFIRKRGQRAGDMVISLNDSVQNLPCLKTESEFGGIRMSAS